jgi:hypothetical protein
MRALLVTLAGALVAASCGKLDTVGGHYAGMRVYQPAGGGYHIHYADPPWALAEAGADYGSLQPVLVVKGVYLGTDLPLVVYQLQVDRVGCSSPGSAATDARSAAFKEGEVVDFEVRDFKNSAGDVGSEFGTHDGSGSLEALLPPKAQQTISEHGFTARVRRTFFRTTDTTGECFRVLVLSIYEVDEHDLTFMLGSFEPREQRRQGSAADGGVADGAAADVRAADGGAADSVAADRGAADVGSPDRGGTDVRTADRGAGDVGSADRGGADRSGTDRSGADGAGS